MTDRDENFTKSSKPASPLNLTHFVTPQTQNPSPVKTFNLGCHASLTLTKNTQYMTTINASDSHTAWHYTTGKSLPGIMKDGSLRAYDYPSFTAMDTLMPLDAFVPRKKPQLWFSMNQFWEPSIPPLYFNEYRHSHHWEEEGEPKRRDWYLGHSLMQAGGLWARFGVPASSLYPVAVTKALPDSKAGRQVVYDQRVSFKNVSIEDCLIEVMHEDLQWKRIHTPKPVWNSWLH
jgi:hypothetical protein